MIEKTETKYITGRKTLFMNKQQLAAKIWESANQIKQILDQLLIFFQRQFMMLLMLFQIPDKLPSTEQVTEQVERLLEVIGNNVYSTKELMELLGLKHRQTFRNNYLLPTMEKGLTDMTIPDKPNSSKQKYRRVK